MDGCPRQNPAYRPATEKPRSRGAFLWADGSRHRAATDPLPCPIPSHADLSDNSDCGKTITDNAAWGLKVKGDHFVPRPGSVLGGGFDAPDRCGAAPAGSAFANGGEEDLFYQWPAPAQMAFEPLPLHKMFDTRFKAFKVEFKSLNLEQMSRSGTGVVETIDDHGSAEATVRFIRQ